MRKEQILDNANKLLQKGLVDKAIAEYRNYLKIDPKNTHIQLKIADNLLKLKREQEAIEEYLKVASTFVSQGFYPKAVAVYKQILKLDPTNIDVNDALAEVYKKMHIVGEALNIYRTLLSIYEKKKDIPGTIKVLKKIIEIDHNNIAAHVKLAELFYHSKKKEEGAKIFKSIYESLATAKREDDMMTILERWLVADNSNIEAIKNICRLYIKRHDAHNVLLKLQLPLKEGIKDPELLGYLAEAYILLNKKEKGIQVLKEIARGYLNQNEEIKAKVIYEKILELSPSDPDALKFLKPAKKKEEIEIEILEEEEPPPPRKVPSPPVTPRIPKKVVETDKEEFINKKFIQAEIFIKYGLKERAIDEYEGILRKDPKNIKALNSLKDLYSVVGKGDKAITHLITLSTISEENGNLEEAIRYLEEALVYDPNNKAVRDKLREISPESIQEEPLLDELAEAEEKAMETTSQEILPNLGIEETPPAESMETSFSGLLEETGTGEEVEASPQEAEELQEQFDEIEFYVQQGLNDEAIKILKEILKKYPENADAQKRLQELTAVSSLQTDEFVSSEPAMEGEVSSEAHVVEEEGAFDLAKELESELIEEGVSIQETLSVEEMPRQISAEEVLQEFKSKVASVISPEDADTHYDLGIAYKEMGLIDEAISEFNISASSDRKSVESFNMLGICYLDKKDFKEAEKYFQLALNSPQIDTDFSKGVLYDLARVYEENGEINQAIDTYKRILVIDSSFRDVNEKLSKLKSIPERSNEESTGKDKTKKVSYI